MPATEKRWPHFDPTALRKAAGEKVFSRGEEYFHEGLVKILALEPARVLAVVSGTERYRTTLTAVAGSIDGNCTCPAYTDWGFCKHLVATALAANAAEGDGAAPEASSLDRIKTYLREQGTEALVGMIADLAEQDPDLFRRLDLAAASLYEDDRALERRLRAALDQATHTHGYIDYRGAGDWAAEVGVVLDTIGTLATGPRAAIAFSLAGLAIERLEEASENLDDSDGHCSELLDQATRIHISAAETAHPEPVQFACELFQLAMASEYGMFDDAVDVYADVLGEEGLAEYRRLAGEAWERLQSPGKGRGPGEGSDDVHRLTSIIDSFAERDGDVEARIALRARDLSSISAYMRLAQFCVAENRVEEAIRWAEEGLWAFEDSRFDNGLVEFTADLLYQAGREADAMTHLWRAFEKAPNMARYGRLRKLGGAEAHERAVKFLEGRSTRATGEVWSSSGDLLVQVLMEDKDFGAAWAAVNQWGASLSAKEMLARASEAKHMGEALAVYRERVDYLSNSGGNENYARAVALIGHIATLQSSTEQASYIAAVKARHGKKRNLMKLME